MKYPTENPDSQFRNISWSESRSGNRAHQLSQRITVDVIDGKKYYGYIYSIDDTSGFLIGTQHFVRKFTISVITERGEVIDWYTVENPINCTYMPNHAKMLQV
jgi:hypothetical protein